MAASLKDLILYFHGRDANDKGGQEDLAEFIENLNFAVDGQVYADENRKLIATRVIFRIHLRGKALLWYHGLSAEIRANWQLLETAFISRFALVAPKEVDSTWFLNLALNLWQKGRSIVEYMREGDQLNAKCPEKFRDVLGHQFIGGLDDKGKVDLVQVYLGAGKSTVTYTEAKQAVIKAYQRFGEPSPLDQLGVQLTYPPSTPTVQSELVALLQALKIPQAPVPRDNILYQLNYPSRDQSSRESFYRGIHCHNCREEGHYSTSCTRPIVSGAQKNANKWAIAEFQEDLRQYPRGPGMVSGLPPAQSALAVVASAGVGRPEQGSQRINNIGMANMVILKRPKKEVKSDYADPVAAATKSQILAPTKISEPKNSRPTSLVTEPLAETIASIPSLFPPTLEDDDMKDSTIAYGCGYKLGVVSSLSKEKRIQFDKEDDGVCDIAEPTCQEPIPTKTQFQVESFHKILVPLPVWPRLDQSPQSKIQLTRAIASSWDFTREEKLAGPTLLGTAAVAAKSYTPPALEPVAHKDKEGCNRLLLKRWTGKVDWGPGAKTIWGRSILEILSFTTAKIMFRFVPKWNNVDGHVQEIRPDFQGKERSPFNLCFLTFS